MSLEILEKLNKHLKCAEEHYGKDNILGVFLCGSQNYGTDTPESDVDTKCILLPNLYHLAVEPYQIKHLDVDGEICECLTIQQMVANWKKQNMNFLEVLFTPYTIVKAKYYKIWSDFCLNMREAIAHYDPRRAILSQGHQALHTLSQDPDDKKKQMNFVRLTTAIRLYVTNHPYRECIYQPEGWRILLQDIRKHGAEPMIIKSEKDGLIKIMDNVDELVEGMSTTKKPAKSWLDVEMNKFIMRLSKERLLNDGLY
jgi:predicted nucleotidyltransferase